MKHFILYISTILIAGSSITLGSTWGWKVLETDHFRIYHAPNQKEKAIAVATAMESAYIPATELTGTQPPNKTVVVVENHGLNINSTADPVNHRLQIWPTPPSTYTIGFGSISNWIDVVSQHELTHMSHLTTVTRNATSSVKLFGTLYYPHLLDPTWFTEGLAVYNESQISPLDGRLNEGYSTAYVHRLGKENELPSFTDLHFGFTDYPFGAHPYMVGSEFINYLAKTYPGKLKTFIQSAGDNRWSEIASVYPRAGLEKDIVNTFGKSWQDLYKDWQSTIKNAPTASNTLAYESEGFILSLSQKENKLYFPVVEAPKVGPFLRRALFPIYRFDTDTRTTKQITTLLTTPVTPIQVLSDRLVLGVAELEKGYENFSELGFGYETRIIEIDPETGDQSTLVEGPYRSFYALTPKDLILVKDNNGSFGSEIWQWHDQKVQKRGNIPLLISEIIPYEDSWIVVGKTEFRQWSIYKLDLNSLSYEPIIDTAMAESLIHIKDGSLYFTARYSGSPAIYKFDLETSVLTQLSHAEAAYYGFSDASFIFYVSPSITGDGIFTEPIGNAKQIPTPNIAHSFPNQDPVHVKPGSLKSNYKTLAKPKNRIFPFLALGEDELGAWSYESGFYNDGVYITALTKQFAPLTVSFTEQFYFNDSPDLITKINWPAYKKLKTGFHALDVSFTGINNWFNDNDSSLGLDGYWQYPNYEYTLGSSKEIGTKGLEARAGLDWYTKEWGASKIEYQVFSNYHKTLYFKGLGYEDAENQEGYYASLTQTLPLTKIRKGAWRPFSIGIGDLFLELFWQGTDTDIQKRDGKSIHSIYGAGIKSELKVGPLVGVPLTIGFIPTIDSFYFEISL